MIRSGQAIRAVVTGHFELARGQWFAPHVHDESHQLVWAGRGVLSVRALGSTWVLPPGIALWLPAGVHHETGAAADSDMLGIYVDPQRCPIVWTEPTVVAVGGVQRELLLHLNRDDLAADHRRRAEALLFDVLQPVPIAHVDVPDLLDPRAVATAAALRANPADTRSLDHWGREVGASGRTLARLWRADTGLTFGVWRTRLRVRESLPHLAARMSIASAARRVGYETPSAFVAAFRREVGVTPGAYFSLP